jgi:uncharacterized protein
LWGRWDEQNPMHFRFLLAAIVAPLLLLAVAVTRAAETPKPGPAAPGAAPVLEDYWWMFFAPGENQTPLEKAEAEKMQAGHLANMDRLFAQKKLVMAGPLGRNPKWRGVVVLTLKSREEVLAAFADDPFVKAGRLKVEAYRWRTLKGSFGRPAEPQKMGRYHLVALKKGPKFTDAESEALTRDQQAHLKHIFAMRDAGDLLLAGPFQDAGDLRGIFVFKNLDEKRIEALIAADPHIISGRMVAERLPFFTAEGVLPGAR